jgi:hypothetical protein
MSVESKAQIAEMVDPNAQNGLSTTTVNTPALDHHGRFLGGSQASAAVAAELTPCLDGIYS